MQAQTKAIILARVSSKTQEDEGYSLDSQLKLMRDYCKSRKLDIVQEFKIAETASKEQRRKIYHEMLAYITKHRVFNVVVEKTDRLTRNFKDATMIDAWLEKDEHRMLHLVKENLLLHKDARSDAKFMWNIYLSVAKKYTDNLREEAMKGWAEKLAQGWLPAEPPPGYMTITQDGKKIHVVNPETYRFMPRIFKLVLLPGYTRKKLSEEMALVGITTKTGRPFSASAVTRILTNPFYIGVNRMQGRDYPGAQEPIITKKLFNEVQRKLKRRGYEQKPRKHNPVFKRIIVCESCGKLVSWSKQKGRFYGACQRRKAGCWNMKYLREDRVEALVVQKIEAIDDSKKRLLAKLKAALLIVQPQDVGMYREKMIDELRGQIAKMQRMEERLYDDRLSGFITKEKYEEKRRQLAGQASVVAERMAMLREAQNAPAPLEQKVESDNPIVDLYLKSSPHQKRIILTILFKRISAAGEVIHFVAAAKATQA
ncbi:MAG TPA: recombinase family protein [Candidatus Saccharimonadales bacterium]|nr:recombinase family protein [Candidatus Saccharimonadales bacterium]